MADSGYNKEIQRDPWWLVKQYTTARIAMGNVGVSIPSNAMLQFRLDHAHARDAVYSTLYKESIGDALSQMGINSLTVQSSAKTRQEYIQRPDLGRKLAEASRQSLSKLTSEKSQLTIMVADGLSAIAANDHFIPLMNNLLPALRTASISLSPIVLIEQGRVAISDEIAFTLKSELALILIGERPGLSSPNSLGAYLTYGPKPGLTDESRNCVSNIRPEGLNYSEASRKIFYLISQALARKLSGVSLKDNTAGDFLKS
ncbi:MAG: ethanolamine ammonia-lyase subunit EutC [Chryseolinea sp.]